MTKKIVKKQTAQIVFPRGKGGFTNTLIIADKFGIRHDRVIRKLEKLVEKDVGGLTQFGESFYLNSQNKSQKMYEMNKSNFIIFAFKFTQSKALYWQKRFIKQFEFYERQYKRRFDPDWIDAREGGKPTRLQLTDVTKQLRLQVMEQNPDTTYREQEDLIYVHYTKVIYQALFIFNMPLKKVRDMLSIDQIKDVDRLESLATDLIVKLMFVKTHYKEIYHVIKEKAIAYGDVVGKSNVPLFQQKQLALF